MRRLIAAPAALALLLGGMLVGPVGPASADITAPAANAVLRGNATLSASGAGDGTACLNADGPRTVLQLLNASGQVVFESVQNGTGAKSVTVDTHGYPNGSYTARAVERNRSGFLYCQNNTKTTNRSVRIDNITQLAYSGATEAPQNTTATVRATLTDPNLASSVLPNRTVTFALSGGTSVTATTNAQGVATASLPVSGPPRSATLTASFAQTTHYQGSSASVPFTVGKNASTTTLQQPSPVVHGQPVAFTAQVGRVDGTSTPTGTVQFTVDGVDHGAPVPVVDGLASSPAGTLSTGSHTIGARYSGDGNLLASSAGTRTLVVAKAPTSTVLTSTGSPTVSGEAVTFTATVAVVAPGAGEPAGSVQFDVDGEPYGTAVPLDGDAASLTIRNLRPGNHRVQATYNGDPDLASSTSAEVTHGVNRADTTLTLTTSDPDALAGQPLTFTADVAVVGPGAGSPSGVVQFAADGDPLGDPVPLNGGSAVSPPTGLPAGVHTITADYHGDEDFAGATDELRQQVAAAATTTTVTSSPNPSVVGQPVTVRAVVAPVAPARGAPKGAVLVEVDGEPVRFQQLADGAAEVTLTGLSRGNHEVTATYLSADPSFVTSTSEPVTHVVNKAATRTVVESSSPTSVTGQPVTFTATVTVVAPGAGSPSGTVTFTDGSTVLGTAEVDPSTGGRVSVTTDALAVGQHAVVATYDGDESFQGSSGSVSQRVQRAQTSTLVTSSANPSRSGEDVRFTAEVAPVAPGAGEPTGTVRFTVNGAPLGAPVDLVDGMATSTAFASLSPGTYRVEAAYSGDPRFVGSSGRLDQGAGQDVVKGATRMTLASDHPAAAYGQPVTFTANVAAVAPATGRPTGVVRFWHGDVLLGATSLAPAGPGTGEATFTTSALPPGQHEVRAVYLGSFNFHEQVATTAQAVGAVPTATGVAAGKNPATYGEDVVLTAVVAPGLPAPGAPGGSVTFTAGDDVLGTADVGSVGGQRRATLTLEGLAPGTYEVVASYSGGAGFAPSRSAPYLLQVERAAATLVADTTRSWLGEGYGWARATLTGVDGEPLAGQPVRFTATHPGGLLCEAISDGEGLASCEHAMEPSFVVFGYDATFAGNDLYLPATSHGGWVD